MTTAVTADQIAKIRRMVNEPTTTVYSDATITVIIEDFPTLDLNGEAPKIPIADLDSAYTMTAGQDVTDLVTNPDWIPTYDLNAAASEIWAEKSAVPAGDFDFSADGGNYSRSQVYEQCMKQSRFYGARRKASTITLHPKPHRRQDNQI